MERFGRPRMERAQPVRRQRRDRSIAEETVPERILGRLTPIFRDDVRGQEITQREFEDVRRQTLELTVELALELDAEHPSELRCDVTEALSEQRRQCGPEAHADFDRRGSAIDCEVGTQEILEQRVWEAFVERIA